VNVIVLWFETQVSRLGTDRSSMEAVLLTCLQAQLLVSRINAQPSISNQIKNDLIWEVKQVTEEKCQVDAKAD
jgi:hypothetical protein